jgi:hypothetical protein
MSAIAGAFCANQFVDTNICNRPRLAATNAGCTVVVEVASKSSVAVRVSLDGPAPGPAVVVSAPVATAPANIDVDSRAESTCST